MHAPLLHRTQHTVGAYCATTEYIRGSLCLLHCRGRVHGRKDLLALHSINPQSREADPGQGTAWSPWMTSGPVICIDLKEGPRAGEEISLQNLWCGHVRLRPPCGQAGAPLLQEDPGTESHRKTEPACHPLACEAASLSVVLSQCVLGSHATSTTSLTTAVKSQRQVCGERKLNAAWQGCPPGAASATRVPVPQVLVPGWLPSNREVKGQCGPACGVQAFCPQRAVTAQSCSQVLSHRRACDAAVSFRSWLRLPGPGREGRGVSTSVRMLSLQRLS